MEDLPREQRLWSDESSCSVLMMPSVKDQTVHAGVA
jgi:hypothetical protein